MRGLAARWGFFASAMVLVAASSVRAEPDFRKAKWGMSQLQVWDLEGPPETSYMFGSTPTRSEASKASSMKYARKIGPYDAEIEYYFYRDKWLNKGTLTFRSDVTNAYNDIVSTLTERHGSPKGYGDWIWTLKNGTIKVQRLGQQVTPVATPDPHWWEKVPGLKKSPTPTWVFTTLVVTYEIGIIPPAWDAQLRGSVKEDL